MLTREDLEKLSHTRATLAMALDHHAATDTANATRNGTREVRRSPLTQGLMDSLTYLDEVMRGNQYEVITDEDYRVVGYRAPASAGGFGDLLAHVTDTDADPAHVREGMSDAQANAMLTRSLVDNGSSLEDAQAVADLYVPLVEDTTPEEMPQLRALHDKHSPVTLTGWDTRAADAAAVNGRPASAREYKERMEAEGNTPTPRDVAEYLRRTR